MAPLSIHYASQLINHPTVSFECLALIHPFPKPIYVIADEFTQQDLDKHSSLLNAGIEDEWLSKADSSTAGY